MSIELFHRDGCPSWTVANERLTHALVAIGRDDVAVQRRSVETATQAEAVELTGSPTREQLIEVLL